MANNSPKEEFDWIKIQTDISFAPGETTKEKFVRKFKENPFVPIGSLVTAGVLAFGLNSFRKGDSKKSQLLMRARVLAQGFTIVALVSGILIASTKRSVN